MLPAVPELASLHRIRRAAGTLLGTRALSFDDLIRKLRAAGLELGPDPVDTLMHALDGDGRFAELRDERWVSVPHLLEGTEWTTTPPDPLPADDCLPVEPDFTLLGWWALDTPLRLADPPDGTLEYHDLDDGTSVVHGPPGWLEGSGAITLRVVDGTVACSRVAQPPSPSDEQARAARDAFDAGADHDELEDSLEELATVELVTMPLQDLLWEALVAARKAFAVPVAPIDALLAAAGLERNEFTVGIAGTDWEAWHHVARRRRIAFRHDLSDDQLDLLETLLGASYAVVIDGSPALGPSAEEPAAARFLAFCLADPAICRAFVGEHNERETEPADLALFARLILEHLDDDVAATGPHWLLARALDHLGDPAGARAELETAVASGMDHPLALRALAGFCSDAGDAHGALALLRRAGLDAVADDADPGDEEAYDPLFFEVVGFAVRPPPRARRNDRCPCGSGRKYKDCHLGRERLPLADRSAWLYRKARRYLRDGQHRMVGTELATVMERASGRGVAALLALLDSELVDDVALSEGGVFDDFLADRDAILPDDEALLAARWALIERSLFEVEAIHGEDVTMRDLRTGDTILVTNTTAEDETRVGALLIGRPLPVDDTWRAYSGFVPVNDRVRDQTLAALDHGDAFEVAAAIGATFAPITMQNTDGEPLVFHELTFRVADPEQASRALLASSALQDRGDGHFTLARDTVNQPDTVILSLELDGDEVRVSANSDRRAAEAIELIAQLLPDAVLDDHDLRPFDEMMAAPREPSDDRTSDNDRELAAMLDTMLREGERRWVDEPVPALRGLTPRQAADDPVAREELERLLRSFDDRRGAGGFDTDRIRELLGLGRSTTRSAPAAGARGRRASP
jgi:hypothetical protein